MSSPPPPPPAPPALVPAPVKVKAQNSTNASFQTSIHAHRAAADESSAREALVVVKIPDSHVKLGHGDHKRTLKILFTSDTHGIHKELKFPPEADIFIHGGDFTNKQDWRGIEAGKVPESVIKFNEWLGKLPYKHKIVIAGNHEVGFNHLKRREIQKILTNCTYIQDKAIEIEGIKFYGTPWTTSHNMGFSMSSDKIAKKWEKIPEDTEILITHLPPKEIRYLILPADSTMQLRVLTRKARDYAHGSNGRSHWGSTSLRERVAKIKPKFHLFGHVHEEAGFTFNAEYQVLFVNAAADIWRNTFLLEVNV